MTVEQVSDSVGVYLKSQAPPMQMLLFTLTMVLFGTSTIGLAMAILRIVHGVRAAWRWATARRAPSPFAAAVLAFLDRPGLEQLDQHPERLFNMASGFQADTNGDFFDGVAWDSQLSRQHLRQFERRLIARKVREVLDRLKAARVVELTARIARPPERMKESKGPVADTAKACIGTAGRHPPSA